MIDEEIVDEINALRNDLIEPGGILDELKKNRELLESINWILKNSLLLSREPTPADKLRKEIEEKYGHVDEETGSRTVPLPLIIDGNIGKGMKNA